MSHLLHALLAAQNVAARPQMLTLDPSKRITLDEILTHPWCLGGPQWEPVGSSVYTVRIDPYSGSVKADEQLLQELEQAGHPRASVLKALLAGESNHATASYYLLAEGKAETLQRLRGTQKALLAGESNHATASYYLLAEGKAETLQRLRGTQKGAPHRDHRPYSTIPSSVPLAPTVPQRRT
eukprot:gene2247-7497_t